MRVVCRLHLGAGVQDHARALEMLAESGCLWRREGDDVLACGPPAELRTEAVEDEDGTWHRLHAEDAPALAWPGLRVHAIHGVIVPEQVVEAPETLDPAAIADERDAEVRRVMVDRYGPARFLREIGAARLDKSDEWGTLWQVRGDRGGRAEPLTLVECVNGTPERDGSFRHYWLHVPPWVRTAHEALAWTFGLRTDEYAPTVES